MSLADVLERAHLAVRDARALSTSKVKADCVGSFCVVAAIDIDVDQQWSAAHQCIQVTADLLNVARSQSSLANKLSAQCSLAQEQGTDHYDREALSGSDVTEDRLDPRDESAPMPTTGDFALGVCGGVGHIPIHPPRPSSTELLFYLSCHKIIRPCVLRASSHLDIPDGHSCH
eukprot:6297409-Pyramimonas_sp.AAC.2